VLVVVRPAVRAKKTGLLGLMGPKLCAGGAGTFSQSKGWDRNPNLPDAGGGKFGGTFSGFRVNTKALIFQKKLGNFRGYALTAG